MRDLKFDIISKQAGSDKLHHDVMTLEEIERAEPDYMDYEVVARRQYTGLKDKNDKEIYEGDILSDGAVVEWFNNLAWDSGGSLHSGFYSKKWADYSSDDITTELSHHNGFDDCEVIGNIYENSRLLK